MSELSVLIADDEELARERLTRIVTKLPNVRLCAEAENGLVAVEKTKSEQPDVVLLDIRMPEMDGIDAAKQIANLEPAPAVIFCTAYDEYALKAFQANAIGYLLKPVRESELIEALRKTQKLSQAHISALNDLREDDTYFIAHTWNGKERIALADILYFRADHKYLSVIHKKGETLSNQTLKELEKTYESSFIRLHRSTLVNEKHIKRLVKHGASYQITLSSGESLEVSRRHLPQVRERFEHLQS